MAVVVVLVTAVQLELAVQVVQEFQAAVEVVQTPQLLQITLLVAQAV